MNKNTLLFLIIKIFASDVLDAKIKQKALVNISDISNLVKNSDLNSKFATLATKAALKAEQDKTLKLQTFDLNHFLGKILFGDDGSQNMLVYQPKLDTLELKKGKGTDYLLSWKSKWVYNSELKTLYTAYILLILYNSIKLSGYKVRIKLDKEPSAVEQNNCAAKIVNAYIVYDLDTWPNNSLRNFALKINSLVQLV